MLIHDDLSTRVVVHAATLDWVPSPGRPLRATVGAEPVRVWYKIAPLLANDVCAFDREGA